MNSLKVLLIIFFTGISTGLSAQTYVASEKTNSTETKRSLFNSGFYDMQRASQDKAKIVKSSNQVYLTQVGALNTITINTQTNSSDIKVDQNGTNNNLDLNYVADHAMADIIQNGTNNQIVDYVNLPGETIDLNITQNGSNLNFNKYGSNNLTESLQFKQTGLSKTLIVRSFK